MSYFVRLGLLLYLLPTLFTTLCKLKGQLSCGQNNICYGKTEVVADQTTSYHCKTPLILSVNDSIYLEGNYSGLILTADTITLTNLIVEENLTATYAQKMSLSGTVQVKEYLIAQSSKAKDYQGRLEIKNCSLSVKKMFAFSLADINIEKSQISSDWPACIRTKIGMRIYTSNIKQNTPDSSQLLQKQMNIFIMARKDITISSSDFLQSVVVLVAADNIILSECIFNSSARSCRMNGGNGRGARIQDKNVSCIAGSSSFAAGGISHEDCQAYMQYFQFLTHSFPYMRRQPFLQTGSGGYGYGSAAQDKGVGGGAIYMYSRQRIQISNVSFLADGGESSNSQIQSSGSGGMIALHSQILNASGTSLLSVRGGASWNNNGSGSGGLIKMSFNQSNANSNSVSFNVNQGYQPSKQTEATGMYYGPICPPGTELKHFQCVPCQPGYYSTFGSTICRECPNSQEFVLSSKTGSASIRECLVEKQISLLTRWIVPKSVDLISVEFYIGFLLICTGLGCILRKKIKIEKLAETANACKLQDVKRDIEAICIVAEQMKTNRDVNCHELMYHKHRIACAGFNNEESAWMIPSEPPQQILKDVLPQAYKSFARIFNRESSWSDSERLKCRLLSCLLYPAYWYYMDHIKKLKYQRLVSLVEEARESNLINNYDCEDRDIIGVKISKNKDYTICYLDFFRYEQADLRYFTLSSPFLIYFSGEGNFLRPFYIDDQDVFLRAMFFAINRNIQSGVECPDDKLELFDHLVNEQEREENSSKLVEFIRHMNILSCALDLSAPLPYITGLLLEIIRFVQNWNEDFFSRVLVRLDLLLMVSLVESGEIIQDQIHILTNKNEADFKQFLISKMEDWKENTQNSLKISLLIFNPNQELASPISNFPPERPNTPCYAPSRKDSFSNNAAFLTESLIANYDEPNSQLNYPPTSKPMGWFSKFQRAIRYCAFSHRHSKYDQWTIRLLQGLLILLQAMLIFVCSIQFQLPYIFLNLLAPFIGLIWFISNSYGFGKLYLIFNAMTLINSIVTLFSYTIIQLSLDFNIKQAIYIIKIIVSELISIAIGVGITIVGCRAVTYSKKVSSDK